jgi:DNA repair exonuclease SbcCD ATPase subunit
MEHIKSFRINSLTVEGFKNFTERKTFDFGDVNYITGHNGLGKTTIADAIAYAIAGVPFSGEQSLDRLYTMGTRDMRVELSITADGAVHTLIRERVNDGTAITWDGARIRQSDMVSMFGEKDVFLSVLNPLYFIEVLGDKGRNLLERCLPSVSHGDVMERLSDKVREVLKDARAMPSDTYLEKLRADIRELESGIVYTEGQRDMLALQSMEAKSKLTDKQTEIAALDNDIAELEDKYNSADIPALKEFRGTLYSKYGDVSHDDTIASETAKVAALFENARTRYTRENGVLKNLRPGVVCPTCKQRITELNIESVRKSFSASLAAVVDEGNALKKRLAELKAQAEKRLEYMGEIKAQIQSVEVDIECGGLTPEEKRRLDTLKAERNMLAIELEAIRELSQSEPSVKDGEIVRLKDAIAVKRELESAVKIYAQERYALMFRNFDTLNRVDVVLYDAVKKTGEAKSVFKFTYDGRPYKFLSLSEKIKAGLELSELIKKLTDSDYPVFIDNGESVPVIDNVKPSGQIFVSQVVKLAPLEVKVVDMPRADMPRSEDATVNTTEAAA